MWTVCTTEYLDESKLPDVAVNLRGITPIKYVINVHPDARGQYDLKTPQGDDLIVTGDTMVEVEDGKVVAVLDPGIEALQSRKEDLMSDVVVYRSDDTSVRLRPHRLLPKRCWKARFLQLIIRMATWFSACMA